MDQFRQKAASKESEVRQVLGVWTGLETRQRIMVGVAVFLVFATLIAMSRLAARPNMALLYAGLDGVSAGEVVRALEQKKISHQVRGDSIFVPMSERDSLRMTLAADGLPASSGQGYELLDNMTGFGTTSQMFDAAYWRAKEGELARTIVSSPFVAQARVHIANGSSSPFQRSAKPTASVSVTPSAGAITAEQANALKFLVASAVSGLDIGDVAIIDANGKVLGRAEDVAASASGGLDRADSLREKVMRLVEARVGRGNAIVEVSVDTITETESIRERRFDPNGRVAISTDTEERSNTASESAGTVTVASNLPDGDAANDGAGTAETSEVRERINYEVSEVEREVLRSPGAIRRLTIAVLVNDVLQTNADGSPQFTPRSETELEALQELVASAVGFDEARGDVITIKSMELPAVAPEGTSASAGALSLSGIDLMKVAQFGVLALVALGLGLFVVKPVLAAPPQLPIAGAPALPALGGPVATANGEIDNATNGADPALAPTSANFSDQATSLIADDGAFPPMEIAQENAATRLRSLIEERQSETLEILRDWLETEEKA